MRQVEGYDEMKDQADQYKPGQRVCSRVSFTGDRKWVWDTTAAVLEIATALGLLSSSIEDLDNRWWRKKYGVSILLNGTAAQISQFSLTMKRRDARAS